MSDSTSQLPPRPSLEQLRKQATDRVKTLRAQGIDATLADVQFALAREYGFKDWAGLAHHDVWLPVRGGTRTSCRRSS